MLKNIATCALALALTTGAATGVMAAEKSAAHKPAAVKSLSKQEVSAIKKECQASAKKDKAAFRKCVKEKESVLSKTKATAPAAKDAAKGDATKL